VSKRSLSEGLVGVCSFGMPGARGRSPNLVARPRSADRPTIEGLAELRQFVSAVGSGRLGWFSGSAAGFPGSSPAGCPGPPSSVRVGPHCESNLFSRRRRGGCGDNEVYCFTYHGPSYVLIGDR
jgi:hypothetical protein